MQVDSSSQLASLQTHIQTLSELRDRLHATRQFPLQLIRPNNNNTAAAAAGAFAPHQHLRQSFQQLKTLKEAFCADAVQSALRSAQDSEKSDQTGLTWTGRRQNRKRRRSLLPESPKPYLPPPKESKSLFPETDQPPLSSAALPEYIRTYNRSHTSKIHIWSRTRSAPPSTPTIVRFSVPDVLDVFMTLSAATTTTTHPDDHDNRQSTSHAPLTIETVTAFGPREKKAPHAYSDYTVFQDLSQQLSHTLQSNPHVSFQSFTDLLRAYEGIFVDQCTTCHRVLSLEAHVPPVARVWVGPAKAGESGRWHPRHVACQRSGA